METIPVAACGELVTQALRLGAHGFVERINEEQTQQIATCLVNKGQQVLQDAVTSATTDALVQVLRECGRAFTGG